MAKIDSSPSSKSASERAPPVPMPVQMSDMLDWLPLARPRMTQSAARASLTWFDICDSWLSASRQMVDLWRDSVREQQDSMLASWRQRIVNTLAHDLLEETEPSPRTRRQTRAATAAAETGEAQQVATRH